MVTGEGSATTWAQVRDLMAQGVADSEEARAAAGRTGPGLLVGDGRPRRARQPAADRRRAARRRACARATPASTAHPTPSPPRPATPHDHAHHDHAHDHDHHDHAAPARRH